MKKIFIFFIMVYQRTFGILFTGSCRFTPTCSEYAIEAIKKHGIFKGSYFTIKRLLKCHPYHTSSGDDPVP